MSADAELLRRYVEERSEPAFKLFVERHLPLVYGAALRRTGGDATLAQDVAQAVFTAAAQDARLLLRHPTVIGWLYTTTRNIAAKILRAESARRARERETELMRETTTDSAPLDRERLRSALAPALDALNEREREAVLLRFFEGRAFAEIGDALRISEDAARMRVDRALEKLHRLLARRGITSTAAALGTALASEAAVTVPAGLATAISGAAVAAGSSTGVVSGLLAFLPTSHASTAALVAIAGVLSLNLVQQRANARLQEELATLAGEQRRLSAQHASHQRLAASALALASPADTAELARLRARAEELRRRYLAQQPLLTVGRRAIFPHTPPEERLEIIQPGGRSSPMRAWQTLLQTGRSHGPLSRDDMLDLHALMFCLDPSAQEKARTFLAALPPDARAKFPSVERLLAPVFSAWLWGGDAPQRYSGGVGGDVFVAGNPDRAYSRWQITYASGVTRLDQFPFQRFSDGWRYGPLTVGDVEQMLALLDPVTGQPQTTIPEPVPTPPSR